MSQPEGPQIYLITPAEFDLEFFPDQLAAVLDMTEVACLRIALSSTDEDLVARACDAIRSVAHERDVPVVVSDHAALIDRLGLDGVHLTDGARAVRKLREELGANPIIGAYCGASRHDGLNAAESGTDYVSFGPVQATVLGHSEPADMDLFAWWSEVIEIPVVAEGSMDLEMAANLAPISDFIALGSEIWAQEDPAKALAAYAAAIRCPVL